MVKTILKPKKCFFLILSLFFLIGLFWFSDAKGANLNFQLSKGWNLISSPFEEPIKLSEIAKSCDLWIHKGKFWTWRYDPEEGWTQPDQIEKGEGIYILSHEDCRIKLEGAPAAFFSKQFKKGWNLFSTETSFDEIKGDCEVISSALWELIPGTDNWQRPPLDQKLDQSKGYWVSVKDNCTLVRSLPESFDWRNKDGKNWMTPVKNQGSGCGSCWVFSALGTMEAKYNIQENNPDLNIDLSEQYLVSDCYSKGDCGGGWCYKVLKYLKESGVTDEACYPYQGKNSLCVERCSDWDKRLWKITGWSEVLPYQNVRKFALITKGPFIVRLNMEGWDPETRACPFGLATHWAVIVGYDDVEGVWIIRNSWGPNWNNGGYYKVKYGECNISGGIMAVEGYQVDNVISP